MAKCERRVVTPKPPPVEYVLTLTEDEAAVIYRALEFHFVSNGCIDTYNNAVRQELVKAGLGHA